MAGRPPGQEGPRMPGMGPPRGNPRPAGMGPEQTDPRMAAMAPGREDPRMAAMAHDRGDPRMAAMAPDRGDPRMAAMAPGRGDSRMAEMAPNGREDPMAALQRRATQAGLALRQALERIAIPESQAQANRDQDLVEAEDPLDDDLLYIVPRAAVDELDRSDVSRQFDDAADAYDQAVLQRMGIGGFWQMGPAFMPAGAFFAFMNHSSDSD